MKVPAWILIFMVAAFLFLRIGIGQWQRSDCIANSEVQLSLESSIAAELSAGLLSLQSLGAAPSAAECDGLRVKAIELAQQELVEKLERNELGE
jgi:hypothetical protein